MIRPSINRLNKITAAACFAVLLTACQSSNDHLEKGTIAQQEGYCLPAQLAKNIKLADVVPASEHNHIQLTGRVRSNPEKYYRFVPLLDGVVSKVNFSLGDHVKKGTVLLEVRSPELSSLNAELRTAQAQLKLAKRQLTATQEMFDDGVASERELIEAQQDVEMAQLEITKVQENLGIYGGSLERGVLIIRAPFSGYIVSKNIVSGQQVEAGDEPLFSISDLEEVWVMANVYAGNLSSVKQGMEVEVRASAYPDQVFKGKIDRLANTFDTEERVLKARISIQNRDLLLKPEMFVNVSVTQDNTDQNDAQQHLLSFPAKAMIFTNSKHHLVVYRDSCSFEIVQLEPVYQTQNAVMVKEGLKEGDKVVTENHLLIYNQIQN
ncbi:efflux RND transporter periplasmic adaptor subunit [Pontibacter sp. HSC-14F20]|uniref:efflux RND transporter periplasmic adaptor subunit n=1 Tax=Pontibacter sp. HSC-14F20 TaxID=2864136 RepID=UPI001C72CA13|nr:efflux RND transporter periplasmic adaptor subunit [Pontibacter sp. HSC-14F20]MBX0335408.1 efflux RND transporter periplasmic adaptor subunit [Pontibacter sp. HSC-14F20]